MLRAHSEKTCAKISEYQAEFWKTSAELKNLINHYNLNLFQPLAKRLPGTFGSLPHKLWSEQLKIIDEIMCSMFDQR